MTKHDYPSVLSGDYAFKHKLKAIFFFFGPVAFLALGIAAVDWEAGQAAGGPLYYVGWLLVFLGLIFLFLGLEHAYFKPAWLFVGMLLAELYGIWNFAWAAFSTTGTSPSGCGGSYFACGVALVNIGGYVVSVSETVFFATSAIAVLLPIVVALVAPKDASYKALDRCGR